MLGWQFYEDEVLLTDNTVKSVKVWELPASELDKITDLQKSILKTVNNSNSNSNDSDNDIKGSSNKTEDPFQLFKELTTKAYQNALMMEEDLWRMMTKEHDVSWIHKAPPSALKKLQDKFIEINIPLEGAKKNAELIEKLIGILLTSEGSEKFVIS